MKALLIIDHGSRLTEANESLEDIKQLLIQKRPGLIVEVSHMELAEPSIQTAVDQCVKRGASSVTVHPYMLGPGRHVQEDIPRLVKEAFNHHPTISFEFAPPLGVDPLLADLILKRTHL